MHKSNSRERNSQVVYEAGNRSGMQIFIFFKIPRKWAHSKLSNYSMKLNVDDSIKDNSFLLFLLKGISSTMWKICISFLSSSSSFFAHFYVLGSDLTTLSRHTLPWQIEKRIFLCFFFGSQLFAFCLFRIILLPSCLFATTTIFLQRNSLWVLMLGI